MKVVVAGIYPPDVGGPATYAVLLERELPKQGIEVEVVPFGSVRNLPPLVRHLMYAGKLFSAVRRANVLLVQDTVSSGLPALIAARLAFRPLIVRVPGDYAWEQGRQRYGIADSIDEFQTKRYNLRVRLMQRIQRYVVQNAHAVIVPSHYMERIVCGWRVRPPAVHVIYNGMILPTSIKVPTEDIPDRLIVSIARLVPWKGLSELIAVVAREKTWHLRIIGGGPLRAELQTRITSLGCSDRVQLLGSLPREQTLGWCRAANAFVLNSTYEGLSHVLLEALSLGTPVVVTRVGGNSEVIRSNTEGLLIPANDPDALRHALYTVFDGSAGISRASAISRAEAFSTDVLMAQVAALVQTVVEAHK